MGQVHSLKASYYDALKRLTLELAGVQLGDDHTFLIETRLAALSRREGYETLTAMVDDLFSGGDTRLAVHVVSALLEREQRFFADRPTLQQIEDTLLPRLYEQQKSAQSSDPIRLLSFGCAGGQEPYSLAIMLDKIKDRFPGLKVEIIAVDYPSLAFDRAQAGNFTHFEVQRGLPIRDLLKYFDVDGENWRVKDTLREQITFKEFHLLSNAETLGDFDLVLFRRKLPHYSSPAQVRVLRGLSSMVKAHGFLVLGTGEDLNHINFGFDRVDLCPSVFLKREAKLVVEEDPAIKKPSGRTTFEAADDTPPEDTDSYFQRTKPSIVQNPLEKVEAERKAEQERRRAREELMAKYHSRNGLDLKGALASEKARVKSAKISNPLEKVEAARKAKADRKASREMLAAELQARRSSKIKSANAGKDRDFTPRAKPVKISNPLERVETQRQAEMAKAKARKALADQVKDREAAKRKSMIKSKGKASG